MQFINLLFILMIFIVSAIADTFYEDEIDFFDDYECTLILNEKYSECFKFVIDNEEIPGDSLDNDCKIYSNKCHDIVNNGIRSIPECNTNKTDIDILYYNEIIIKTAFIENSFYCTKNENNEYCPHTLNGLYLYETNKNISDRKKKLYIETINDTCKSKICTEAYLKYVDEIKKLDDNIFEFGYDDDDDDDDIIRDENLNKTNLEDLFQKIKRNFDYNFPTNIADNDNSPLFVNEFTNKSYEYLKSECFEKKNMKYIDPSHKESSESNTLHYSSILLIIIITLIASLI